MSMHVYYVILCVYNSLKSDTYDLSLNIVLIFSRRITYVVIYVGEWNVGLSRLIPIWNI